MRGQIIALSGRTLQWSAFPKHFGSCTAEASVSDEPERRIEVRNRLVVESDVKIPMRDGSYLRCDIFRPQGDGRSARIRLSTT